MNIHLHMHLQILFIAFLSCLAYAFLKYLIEFPFNPQFVIEHAAYLFIYIIYFFFFKSWIYAVLLMIFYWIDSLIKLPQIPVAIILIFISAFLSVWMFGDEWKIVIGDPLPRKISLVVHLAIGAGFFYYWKYYLSCRKQFV